MTDEADTIELAGEEIARLVDVIHKSLNYFQILKLFQEACLNLVMMSEVEYHLKQRQ